MDVPRRRSTLSTQFKCLLVCFVLFIVLSILIFLSRVGARAQFENEIMLLKNQASVLRTQLRSQIDGKQELLTRLESSKEIIAQRRTEKQLNQLELERLSIEILDLQNGLNLLEQQVKSENIDVGAPQIPPIHTPSSSKSSGSDIRKEDVKRAFQHAWNSYKQYAWGKDELKPLTKSSQNWLDLGLTIVDALDTLWIMELYDDFAEATRWVRDNLDFDKNRSVSFFETIIRELGGLLSAYELSRQRVFLDKAEDLAKRLLLAFDQGSIPIPYTTINLSTGHKSIPSWTGNAAILSEIGTIQLEFLYLAYHTNRPEYAIKPLEVFRHLDSLPKSKPGLYPLYISAQTGQFQGNDYSIGALGDSFYEYMLKLWLFTNKQADGYRRMYEEAVRGMEDHLLLNSSSGFRYLSQIRNGRHEYKMEHLTCFSGGMFALGAETKATNVPAHDIEIADQLTTTCHESYKRMPTGIGPESFEFTSNQEFIAAANSRYYILRPEVVESYFVLWRTTKDPKYRKWAWEAFLAIEKNCRTSSGYAGLRDVSAEHPEKDDLQQSFFLAETLKYLYLIFCDDDVIPLDKYVFNTEAHPLGIITNPLASWPDEIVSHLLLN